LSTLFIVQQALFLQLIILLNFGSSISEGILFARQPAQGWNRSMFRQVKPTKISTSFYNLVLTKFIHDWRRTVGNCRQNY